MLKRYHSAHPGVIKEKGMDKKSSPSKFQSVLKKAKGIKKVLKAPFLHLSTFLEKYPEIKTKAGI
jgi:hypothetical protein